MAYPIKDRGLKFIVKITKFIPGSNKTMDEKLMYIPNYDTQITRVAMLYKSYLTTTGIPMRSLKSI